MVRIPRHPIPLQLRINACPACLRMLQLLEHDDPRSLAHDEAAAGGVERAGGGRGGGVGVYAEGFGAAEAGEGERVDAGFGAAGEHDVGVVVEDESGGVAEGMGAGCAGGGSGVVGALVGGGGGWRLAGGGELGREHGKGGTYSESVLHGDMASSHID